MHASMLKIQLFKIWPKKRGGGGGGGHVSLATGSHISDKKKIVER